MGKTFSVDARAILTWGRQSIKDHTTALIELVKNSYDADATRVEVEIITQSDEPCIRVADNGTGMTEDDIDNHWLRIGFSEKTIETVTRKGRRKTGEKGIGRISADRIGAVLELRTKTANTSPYGLVVDWDSFDVTNTELASVPIDVLENPPINLPKISDDAAPNSGTELIIRKLRQGWQETDIQNLSREFSLLIPPFRKVDDFDIKIKTDVAEGYEASVGSDWDQLYAVRLDVDYNDRSEVSFTIDDWDSRATEDRRKTSHTIRWNQLIQKGSRENRHTKLGPVSVTLLFYPQTDKLLEGTGFSRKDLRQFLNNYAGIGIYRDNIRVKPYGNLDEPEGDWLGLGKRLARNPAGAGRRTFRISPTQLVGAVFVSRDSNPELVDSSGREGLIQGEAFAALTAFVTGCVNLVEQHYHETFVAAQQSEPEKISPSEQVKTLNKELGVLKRSLKAVRGPLAEHVEEKLDQTLDKIDSATQRVGTTQKAIQELEWQATTFRGLATIGIAATVFGHETQSTFSSFIGATYNASRFLKQIPPQIEGAIGAVDHAQKYAERVSAWGKFSLDRVSRDKRRRRKLNIKDLITELLQELKPAMEMVSIELQDTELEPVESRTFAMDIEAILINLLTNAYSACLQQRSHRVIRVELKQKPEDGVEGYEIVVADSGPGVAEEFKNRIWDVLFTTKVDEKGRQMGTGLGLTIVQSALDDLGGVRRLDADPELKGARFRIWLPIK